jgi:hypothetical protein
VNVRDGTDQTLARLGKSTGRGGERYMAYLAAVLAAQYWPCRSTSPVW